MIRKFLLVAGLALFQPGSTTQLMLAQLICLGFLCAMLMLAPYKKDEVDYTNQVGTMTFFYACAVLAVRAYLTLARCTVFGCWLLLVRRPSVVSVVCRAQATNLQIMISLLMAMALKVWHCCLWIVWRVV